MVFGAYQKSLNHKEYGGETGGIPFKSLGGFKPFFFSIKCHPKGFSHHAIPMIKGWLFFEWPTIRSEVQTSPRGFFNLMHE